MGHPTVGSERDLPATPTAACLSCASRDGMTGTALHLLQAAPTSLLDELLRVHLLPDVIAHIDCCLLEELERQWQERLD